MRQDALVTLRSECGGTRWRTGGEVKGKLANGVGSQYCHTTLGRSVSSIINADAHTSAAPAVDWTDSPADLNGLVRLGERRKLVSARVPSGSARALLQTDSRQELRHHLLTFRCDSGNRLTLFAIQPRATQAKVE